VTRRTTPAMIAASERAAGAIELRKQGLSYREIAERLGYRTPQGAWTAVKRSLDRLVSEPAHELRLIELARLDALTAALWPRATADPPDIKAINAFLRVSERRAKLAALDLREAENDNDNGVLEAFVAAIDRARKQHSRGGEKPGDQIG